MTHYYILKAVAAERQARYITQAEAARTARQARTRSGATALLLRAVSKRRGHHTAQRAVAGRAVTEAPR